MIIVVESVIDLTTYLKVHFIGRKAQKEEVNQDQKAYHISWSGIPLPKKGEKVYVLAHGGGGQLGDKTPSDLVAALAKLGEGFFAAAGKIILVGCQTGVKYDFKEDIGESTYAEVFANAVELNFKLPIRVTGFAGDELTYPSGKSRALNPEKEKDWRSAVEKGLAGKEAEDKALETWCKKQKPMTPTQLKATAATAAERHLGMIQDAEEVWIALKNAAFSKTESKVYVNE